MAEAKLRIDKWLWQARFFKTRSLAAKQVGSGHVRLNGNRVLKPAQAVAPGDVLTFPQGRIVRVVRIEKLGERRGPAPEAQTLYFDMTEKEHTAIQELLNFRRRRLREDDPGITGFNVGVNCGASAGQTIHHCHVHLIPRRDGDMPDPTGGVRGVIPERMNYRQNDVSRRSSDVSRRSPQDEGGRNEDGYGTE